MTVYGVTPQGFVAKRLPDIKAELEAEYREAFGLGLDVSPESPAGQIIGIHSEREAALWELAEDVYNSAYRDTAEGVSLDNVGGLTSTPRKDETKSTVTAILYGDEGTLIAAGKRASVEGNPTALFETVNDATIGSAVPMVQFLVFVPAPVDGNFTLTYDGQTTTPLPWNATAADIQTALRALSNISNDLTVTDFNNGFYDGFDVTFGGDMRFVDHNLIEGEGDIDFDPTIYSSEHIAHVPARVFVSMRAVEAGDIQAPNGSLTVIETPVTGWDAIENNTTALVGNAYEDDPNYRIRQGETVFDSGACTLEAMKAAVRNINGVSYVYARENVQDMTESGLAPHSYEIAVMGGNEQTVAETIFKNRPGGIQAFGNTTVQVTDSEGYPHDVIFSRPVDVPVYVRVGRDTNDAFPEDGDDQIKAAIVAMNGRFGVGEHVYPAPKLMSALYNIPGIDYAKIEVKKLIGDAWGEEVSLDSFIYEIAKFETSKITVEFESP